MSPRMARPVIFLDNHWFHIGTSRKNGIGVRGPQDAPKHEGIEGKELNLLEEKSLRARPGTILQIEREKGGTSLKEGAL